MRSYPLWRLLVSKGAAGSRFRLIPFNSAEAKGMTWHFILQFFLLVHIFEGVMVRVHIFYLISWELGSTTFWKNSSVMLVILTLVHLGVNRFQLQPCFWLQLQKNKTKKKTPSLYSCIFKNLHILKYISSLVFVQQLRGFVLRSISAGEQKVLFFNLTGMGTCSTPPYGV